ncbi:MAG: hypothetical protein RML45_10830 [Acetobacteraceae bacterium]|nr:hypothetical protein [Acetobacteraceae bacterium]
MSIEAAWSRFTPAHAVLPPGLRPAPDGGPPLREEEAVPMPAQLSFGALLANLNPLHHIPLVGWVYRAVTGETVHPTFRALGGFLFGGPIGAVVSAVSAMAESLFSRRGEAGGVVAPAEAGAPGAATAETAAPPGGALAARLGARAYPAPAQAGLPPLAAAKGSAAAGDPDFAQKMLRGLEAYERTLRVRQGLPPPEPARAAANAPN